MKKIIGFADERIDLNAMLQRQLAIEDRVVFSKQPVAVIERNYVPKKLVLTEAAKHVFAKSINYFKI